MAEKVTFYAGFLDFSQRQSFSFPVMARVMNTFIKNWDQKSLNLQRKL